MDKVLHLNPYEINKLTNTFQDLIQKVKDLNWDSFNKKSELNNFRLLFIWDTRATSHIVNNKDKFFTFKPVNK